MGYFTSLMNITGITYNRGDSVGNQGGADNLFPQSLLRENTVFVEPPVSQSGFTSNADGTFDSDKETENLPLEKPLVPDSGIEEIGITEIVPGQMDADIENTAEEKSGQKEQKTNFNDKGELFDRGQNKVNLRYSGNESSFQNQIPPKDYDETKSPKMMMRDTSISLGEKDGQHTQSETKNHKHDKMSISEPVDKSIAQKEGVLKENENLQTPVQTVKDTDPVPQKIISEAVSVSTSPILREENRELTLSIGTINVIIEEPHTQAEIRNNPPVQTQTESRQNKSSFVENMSSRLGRHYIRL